MKRVVGIYREKEYSPGRHESNDAVLLDAIATRLRSAGFDVDLVTLDSRTMNGTPRDAALVFSMCQGREALLHLAEWERAGVPVLNRPKAALNTHRDHLPAIMKQAGIPFPNTQLVETAHGLDGALLESTTGLWLKRGDVHASVSSDVQWVESTENLTNAIAEFHARGINRAAVQSHSVGDEIKFYGIDDERAFFYWFYSRKQNGYGVDEKAITNLARGAARAAGLTIFGGDMIVDANGDLTLIDLNDWPSFAPCREAASVAIAELIGRRVHAC